MILLTEIFAHYIKFLTINGLFFNCCVLTQIIIFGNNLKRPPTVMTMKLFQIFYSY